MTSKWTSAGLCLYWNFQSIECVLAE